MTVWSINEKQTAGKVGGGTAELSPPRRPTLLTGRRKSQEVWTSINRLSLILGCYISDNVTKWYQMSKSKPRRNESEVEILNIFGKRIKEMRQKKGYSQEEFAHMTGFSRSYYTEIETGKRNVSLLNLLRIMKHLGADVGELSDLIKMKKDV